MKQENNQIKAPLSKVKSLEIQWVAIDSPIAI